MRYINVPSYNALTSKDKHIKVTRELCEVVNGVEVAMDGVSADIAAETERAEDAEAALASDIEDLWAMEQIVIDGGEAKIAQGSDFTDADATKRAKMPTVGAILDGLNDGVYDVSARNGGTTFESLSALLNSNNLSTLIPTSWRKGGMSIRFVLSSDNKYVQFRYMSSSTAAADFANTANWQGVDDEPTAGSQNLVTSGGIVNMKRYSPRVENAGFYINNDGVVHPYDKFSITELIRIPTASTTEILIKQCYNTTDICGVQVYDKDFNHVGYVNISNTTEYTITKSSFDGISQAVYFVVQANIDVSTGLEVKIVNVNNVKYDRALLSGISPRVAFEIDKLRSDINDVNDDLTIAVATVEDDVDELQDKMDNVIIIGNNLFDKDSANIIEGKYIDYNLDGALGDSASTFTTDYMPVEAGKRYCVKAAVGIYGTTNGRNVASYDTNKENYQRISGALKNNNEYIEFGATRNGFVRVSIRNTDRDTAMMVEGTTYPSEYVPYGTQVVLPGYQEMAESIETLQEKTVNYLYGKKALWLGDSIGEAASAGEGVSGTQRYGWSGRIADIYNGTFYSLARSGATITKNLASGVVSIITKLQELYDNSHTGQYLIIEGGTNDADRIGSILDPNNLPVKFGSWTKTDYSGNYDEETFCGAVDSLFYKALTHYKGVKIGFIIAQKMGAFSGTPRVNNHVTMENRRAYFDVIKEMCKKWGIPCLDLWDATWLNPDLVNHYDPSKDAAGNTEAGSYYTDGQHLTAAAYDYLAPVIGKWMETL